MSKYIAQLTHVQRLARRREIAEAVRSSCDLRGTAKKFKVCLESVRTACAEHEVACNNPAFVRALLAKVAKLEAK